MQVTFAYNFFFNPTDDFRSTMEIFGCVTTKSWIVLTKHPQEKFVFCFENRQLFLPHQFDYMELILLKYLHNLNRCTLEQLLTKFLKKLALNGKDWYDELWNA